MQPWCTKALITFGFLLAGGCGRYGLPSPPEAVAPSGVDVSEVKGTEEGVSFSWLAPETDARGKELKGIEGYRIYRKELPSDESGEEEDETPFELLSVVRDRTFARLEEKQAKLRAEGKPIRRASLTAEERQVAFTDSSARKGVTYLYKIAPFNQPFVDGPHKKLVRVIFDGAQSEITQVENLSADQFAEAEREREGLDDGSGE